MKVRGEFTPNIPFNCLSVQAVVDIIRQLVLGNITALA